MGLARLLQKPVLALGRGAAGWGCVVVASSYSYIGCLCVTQVKCCAGESDPTTCAAAHSHQVPGFRFASKKAKAKPLSVARLLGLVSTAVWKHFPLQLPTGLNWSFDNVTEMERVGQEKCWSPGGAECQVEAGPEFLSIHEPCTPWAARFGGAAPLRPAPQGGNTCSKAAWQSGKDLEPARCGRGQLTWCLCLRCPSCQDCGVVNAQ